MLRRVDRTVGLIASLSRLHIEAIAALGTFTFGWLFLGRTPWFVAAIAGLDWLLVNWLNRAVDLGEDRANRIRGTELMTRHRRLFVATGFALLLVSLVLVHGLLPALTPIRIVSHALGLAYNWALLPGRRRIKQLYFWKNMASATGFLLTVFGYPLAAGGWPITADRAAALPPGISPATILLAAVFFLPLELSYEVIYDLRDVAGDRAAGIRSYPVVHGQRVSVWIIDTLLVGSLVPLFVGYAMELVPWRLFIMFVAPALQLVLYKRALRRGGIQAGDCIALTWLGAALLLTYHLWVAAELPGAELGP